MRTQTFLALVWLPVAVVLLCATAVSAKCFATVQVQLRSVSKKRKYNLCVDTGSSTTWLLDYESQLVSYSQSKGGTRGRWLPTQALSMGRWNRLPKKFSSTAKGPPMKKWYGDGTLLTGNYSSKSHRLSIFGRQKVSQPIIIGIVSKIHEYWLQNFESQKVDGYFGLALPNLQLETTMLKIQSSTSWKKHAFVQAGKAPLFFRVGSNGFDIFQPGTPMYDHVSTVANTKDCLPLIKNTTFWKVNAIHLRISSVDLVPPAEEVDEEMDKDGDEDDIQDTENLSQPKSKVFQVNEEGVFTVSVDEGPEEVYEGDTKWVVKSAGEGDETLPLPSSPLVVHLDTGAEGMFFPETFIPSMPMNSTCKYATRLAS
jgi:hypothetical protein